LKKKNQKNFWNADVVCGAAWGSQRAFALAALGGAATTSAFQKFFASFFQKRSPIPSR
jgi:hypothetical protein